MNKEGFKKLFERVSIVTPASVVAQAAQLTLASRKDSTVSRRLAEICNNDTDIESIRKRAKEMHNAVNLAKVKRAKREKKESIALSAPSDVPFEKTRNVLKSELEWISRLKKLRDEDLHEIVQLYHDTELFRQYEFRYQAFVKTHYLRW